MQSALVGFLYIAAAFVCVGLSSYATYHAFAASMPTPAIAVAAAAAIGIGLMVCNITILRLVERRRGLGSFVLPVVLFFVFAAFSAASSFTYFYANWAGEQVSEKRFEEAKATYDANVSSALSALQEVDPTKARRQAVEKLLADLDDQVLNNPLNLGFGENAKKHLQSIRALVTITDIRPPESGASRATNANWLKSYRALVESRLAAEEKNTPAFTAASEIRAKVANLEPRVTALVKEGTSASPRRGVIDERKEVVRLMGLQTAEIQSIVVKAREDMGQPLAMSLKAAPHENVKLETISSVIDSVTAKDNPVMFALTLSFAILLDFTPILIAAMIATTLPSGPATANPRKRKRPQEVIGGGSGF